MSDYCCNRVRQIDVGGVIYNYVLKCNLLDCTEDWCSMNRAIIEIAPKRYTKFHSNKEITEKEIKEVIRKYKEN